MAAAAEKSKCLVQVGSQGKTSPLTAKAREIVQSGVLGKVNMVRMLNHRNDAQGAWKYPVPPDASTRTIDWDRFLGDRPKRAFDANVFFRWRCWWEFSGGVATDLFVHLLTWLHEVMDVKGPRSVVSQGGIYRWNDGRNVPDVMNSIFDYNGFIADMYVNLGSAYPMRAITIMGSQGTLVEERGKLVVYPERVSPDVQSYGTLSWPKAMRASYFESHGYTADGRPRSPLPEPKKPDEITIPPGPSHYELFVSSVREGKPSRETALEGHMAAAAAHLANMAYRESRLAKWDLDTGAA
jgi:predicted dehydrogenase